MKQYMLISNIAGERLINIQGEIKKLNYVTQPSHRDN